MSTVERALPPQQSTTPKLNSTSPADGSSRAILGTAGRSPAVPAAVSFAAGVALDRFVSVPWVSLLSCGVALAAAWVVCLCCRWDRAAALLLVVLGGCAGAARHHQVWSVGLPDDLSRFASDERKLVCVSGTLVEEPRIRVRQKDAWRAAWPRLDFSQALVRCRLLRTSDGPVAVSGCAQLQVTGHLLHVGAGDEVEFHGWLSRPNTPRKPREF